VDLKRTAIALALVLLVLWRNLPGALLCLWPRLLRARALREGEAALDEGLFAQMESELSPLGFRRLGAHLERPPLKRARLVYDFVSDADLTFASATGDGQEMALTLLTGFDNDGLVLTADHKRLSADKEGHFLAGGLPGVTPDQLLAAHRRRIEALRQTGRRELPELDLAARVRLVDQWVRTAGARELRLRHANAFILSLMTLAMLGALVVNRLR
jgi:hypothetical protein